jgi:NAD(P)-dependent dehydrogenase (short-subunit alcohol dehydrogenase family)
MSPRGRLAMPEEVAGLALHLASDDSAFSTGAQFVVDGGLSSTHPTM